MSLGYSFPYWDKGAFPSGKRIGTVGLPVTQLESKLVKKKKNRSKNRFSPFIETQQKSSDALEPLQDWVRPCLPTECLEEKIKMKYWTWNVKSNLKAVNYHQREKQQFHHQDHMLSHSNHKPGGFHQQQTICKDFKNNIIRDTAPSMCS